MRARPRLVLAVCCLAVAGTTSSFVTASATGGTFGTGTPGFAVSAAPNHLEDEGAGYFYSEDLAGEPSIGVDWTTGKALYQAFTSTYAVTFDNSTSPPTVTWHDAASPFSVYNLDPILATDSATGTTMAGGDDGACAVMSVTHDDGASWTPTLPCPIAADHPTVGIGPFHAPTPIDASGPEVAYFCQQPILTAAPEMCSYSHDGGRTWRPSVPDATGGCHGLFGHVKVAPDGTAYIPVRKCTGAGGTTVVGGMRSVDNGQTLTSYTIPGATSPARGFDPSVAVTRDGRVYQTWSRSGDYHPVVSWSDNGGASWSAPVDLTTFAPGLTAGTFEAAVGGDAGRAAIAFLGTSDTDPANTPFDGPFHGTWYLYVAYTYDGGATWTVSQADPEPVQRGGINDGGTTSTDHRNLLDFIDASLTRDGRVVVGYADGCLGSCNGASGTAADSATDNWATVAYQSEGKGLYSAYDTP